MYNFHSSKLNNNQDLDNLIYNKGSSMVIIPKNKIFYKFFS
jgi:hypothetical protein